MKKINSLLVLPFLFLAFSCAEPIGKGGTYNYFVGKATVTEIKTTTDSTCKDAVDVIFDFKPDNADDVKKYIFTDFKDQNISMFSMKPSKTWVDKKGIKVGSVYTAKRSEIQSNTGTSAPFGIYITDMSITNISEPDFCAK